MRLKTLLILPLLVASLKAASVSDLTFTLNGAGTQYSVTDCLTSASGSLDIPSTYNGLPVTSIGDWAFRNCTNLTSITFEGDAPTFGSYVFLNSDSVTIYYYDDASGFSTPTFQGRPSQILIRGTQFQIIEGDFTWQEAKADANAETKLRPGPLLSQKTTCLSQLRALRPGVVLRESQPCAFRPKDDGRMADGAHVRHLASSHDTGIAWMGP